MSPRTIYLGKLLGLYCVIAALVMMSHKQTTVDTMTALVHDAPLLFYASVVAMIAGLAIVLAHNIWSGGASPFSSPSWAGPRSSKAWFSCLCRQ